MKIRITNLSATLDDERPINELLAEHLKISVEKILSAQIVRRAVDARHFRGAPIKFNYVVDVEIRGKIRGKNFQPVPDKPKEIFAQVAHVPEKNPVVIGFGPAGMFAALTLARCGVEPIIFERGGDTDSRVAAVEKFFNGSSLDENSNVQFGEGGAGTFSDGKLTTRLNDPLIDFVLKTFVDAGAPEEILSEQKPHVGTDNLRTVVKNIRNEILSRGGKIFFNAQVTDVEIVDGKISGVIVNDSEKFSSDAIFLAVGHSARDTYEMLNLRGVAMSAKDFAVGVRIEHPQEFINRAQYGEDFRNPKLPVAEYVLTFKDEIRGRGAYSFCMCPGGQIVAATSTSGHVVTNGMSNFRRDSGTANAALVVTVGTKDFGSDILSGVNFQKNLEQLAFIHGGKNYRAPIQTVGDFINGRTGSKNFLVKPTYPIGFTPADLHEILPREVCLTMIDALKYFDKKISGFAADDIPLTGVETRTSSPVRILRDDVSRQSVNVKNFYPIGEGAGYSGGITSSAIDGIKSAKIFLKKFLQTT
ncbi:MAG: FAD-dependent oxidoreductase [Selenomonadaceae bacterium]|nr:FAD-dependent oxidoreductase [Selenomonadaceae bacterium]